MGVGEFEPAEERHDRELTLGPVLLLSLLCGLVLLCGLFFGFGYAAGRRGTVPANAAKAPSPAAPMQIVATDATAKPSATAQQPCQPQQLDITNPQATGNVLGDPVVNPQNGGWQPVATAAVAPGQTMPGQQPGGYGQNGMAGQATQQHQPLLMVQVAALSRQQDARVLMSALQKRGYQVISRREPADGLIHVQIGPFSSRDDANAMTQRLLGDGYNAIIVP